MLVDFMGRALTSEYAYPEPLVAAGLATKAVQKVQASLVPGQRERIAGVGVAVPYFIGGWADELGIPGSITGAGQMYDLPAALAREIALLPFFENDTSSAATAELVYGYGRDTRDFFYLSISTFIGGGMIIGGSLETGPHGNTGAFGPYSVGSSHLSSVRPLGDRSKSCFGEHRSVCSSTISG